MLDLAETLGGGIRLKNRTNLQLKVHSENLCCRIKIKSVVLLAHSDKKLSVYDFHNGL